MKHLLIGWLTVNFIKIILFVLPIVTFANLESLSLKSRPLTAILTQTVDRKTCISQFASASCNLYERIRA